jgi:MoxR-like ATPase
MKSSKRVTLRGFDEAEKAAAIQTLTQAGYAVVSTVTASDMVVVGGLGWSSAGNLSNDRATAVLKYGDLLRSIQPQNEDASCGSCKRCPIIERIDHRHLRVVGIDVTLPDDPASGGQVPDRKRFEGISLDRPFLRAARAVALGVAHGFPTALEGVTAASKTTVILWLAHHLRQPVIRLNLNGQSDTTELIGRWVPNSKQGNDWDLAALNRLERFLKPETRDLLQTALAERRGLDWAEASLVAAAEGLQSPRWRFQEGIVPTALRHGAWVLLDELNLGEPQILERLNPILELPPTLHLSEGDGTTFGSAGDVPVHQGFRVFAAMNPSDYAGRSKLSPAFKDRFINWHQAEAPGEAEYLAQLNFLIFGLQPEVVLDGCLYQGDPVPDPIAGGLRDVRNIETLIKALASCQASLAHGTASGRRREVTPFTRRSLNALIDLWRHRVAAGNPRALQSSLRDLYWSKIADVAERKAAIGVAEAAGLPVGN